MAASVTHSTTVVVADDPAFPVGSDEWNAGHVVTGVVVSGGVAGGQTIIGGTATTDTLTYKTTTGVGTTGADHIFKVGNNGATEAMRILNNGNVGIGTTGPGGKLGIVAAVLIPGLMVGGNGLAGTEFKIIGGDGQSTGVGWRANTIGSNYTLSATNVPTVAGVTSYTKGYAIGFGTEDATDTGISFWSGSGIGSAMTEKVRIQNTGNVGIGTTAPGVKLEVAGVIKTTDTTASTSATTGALIVAGGLGVAGAQYGTTEFLSTAIADNTATTQVATTAFAKKEDAVLRRHPTQAVNLTYASSSATGIAIADNDNIDVGTTDFALAWIGSLPDWTPGSNAYLLSKQDAGVGYILSVLTTGALRLSIYRPTGTGYSTTALTSFIDGTSHSITVLVARETASVDGSIAFYVDGVLFETVAIDYTVANAGTSLSNSDVMYVNGYSTKRYVSTVSFVAVYNRLLTGAQVLDLYRNGITHSDKWGSVTAKYTSDFSAGVDSWIATRGTVAGNIDSIGGENDWLRLTITDTTSNTHHIRRADALLQNKKYRMSLKYYIPSGQTNTYGLAVCESTIALTSPYILSPLMTAQDTVTSVSFEFETLQSSTWNGILYIAPYVGTSTTFQDAGGDDVAFYIKEIVLTELGATLALQPEGIQPSPGQWLDSSTNKLHAMQPAAGSSLTRPKQEFEVRWTNTWAGTHEPQYLGGLNQAILPANCYLTNIIGVISGTTIEDIILGDGSDTDHWVAATTGLAAGTVAFTIANPISDGTNFKMIVDPDANFTGSITWTIKGIILS